MTKLISLITGAAGGIGRSIAHRLSKNGYHVVLTDRPERHEALVAIKQDIEKTGGDATIHSADISVEKEVDIMIAETAKQLGGLDVVCAKCSTYVNITHSTHPPLDRWLQMQVVVFPSHSSPVSDRNSKFIIESDILF